LRQVSCATHGTATGARVCRHLREGSDLGFHYEAARDAQCVECPDAWCDDCHAVLGNTADWADEFAAQAQFKVVCSHCYALIRANNWVQDDEAWQALVQSSVAYLQAQQEVLSRDFRLGAHERWDWEQESAVLTFSSSGQPAVLCDVALVGSLSLQGGTWLWSWANESLLEPARRSMLEVRDFGEQRGFERLAGAFWEAGEQDGWEMAAVAAKFLGGIGAYRAPGENTLVFMVITGARWAQ
jgi:hypothetical protein